MALFGLTDDNLAFNTRIVHSPITIQGIESAVLHGMISILCLVHYKMMRVRAKLFDQSETGTI